MKRFPPLPLPLEKIAQEIAVAIILENFKTITKQSLTILSSLNSRKYEKE